MAKAYIERPEDDKQHKVTIKLGEVHAGKTEAYHRPYAIVKVRTNAEEGPLAHCPPDQDGSCYHERLLHPGDEFTVIIED